MISVQLRVQPGPPEAARWPGRSRRRDLHAAAAVPLQRAWRPARRHHPHSAGGSPSCPASRCRTSGPRSSAPARPSRRSSAHGRAARAGARRRRHEALLRPDPHGARQPVRRGLKEIWRSASAPPGRLERLRADRGRRRHRSPPGGYLHAAPDPPGKRNDDFDVRIVDDDDRELPRRRCRRDHRAPRSSARHVRGLLATAGRARCAVMRNLWFHTGDIGKFDEDGFFYFVDRKKDYLRAPGREHLAASRWSRRSRCTPTSRRWPCTPCCRRWSGRRKVTAVLKVRGGALRGDAVPVVPRQGPVHAVPPFIESDAELPKNPQRRVRSASSATRGARSETGRHRDVRHPGLETVTARRRATRAGVR